MKKPRKFEFNLVVIGAGSAGLVSTFIGATVKSKVALIEKEKMGGDCLNTGCVPSKAIISSAKHLHNFKMATKFGLDSIEPSFNFQNVMQRVKSIIDTIAPNDSIERYENLGVHCFLGQAKIISPYEVQIKDKILTTRSIIIASGASPLIPPIASLEKIDFLTSNNLWDLKELPKKMIILGGGPIGIEMAQTFSRLGARVTIVEMQDQIMSREDNDVSGLLTQIFKSENIEILIGHKAVKFEKREKDSILICENNKKDMVKILFDKILIALGRKPNVKGLGLEEIGIAFNKNGTIQTDEYLRTNYPNIYACGDVVGPYQFTHSASYQAWYATVNALFGKFKKFKIDYHLIPWVTFSDPEVARVGLNEKEAKQQNISYQSSIFHMNELDRAITDNKTKGFVKVLTVPKKDKILGVTIVSAEAGNLLPQYILAMKYNLGLNKILNTIYPYPTMSEANKFVAGIWKKQNKPEKILKFLEKFHSWQRN